MQDALRRVIGLKAKLKLHKKKEEGTLLKTEKELEIIGCEEHLKMRSDAADIRNFNCYCISGCWSFRSTALN